MRGAWILLVLLFPGAGAAASVELLGGFFDPASIDVEPGGEITFVNADSIAHTVTSTWDDGATFDAVLRPGESLTLPFGDEGAFPIHCRPHAGMEMVVQVAAIDPSGAIRVSVSKAPALAFGLILVSVVLALALARRARRRSASR